METLTKTIAELKARLAELEAERRVVGEAIEALERISRGDIVVKRPDGTTLVAEVKSRKPRRRSGRGPGTTKAAITIIGEAGPIHDEDILAAMEERGWAPDSPTPLNALRATLSRLRRDGTIVRIGEDGAYVLQNSDSPNRESGESDVSRVKGDPHGPPLGS